MKTVPTGSSMPGHLTFDERRRIARFRYRSATRKKIAEVLGRSPTTVGRELKRNGDGSRYRAAEAQHKADRRRCDRPLSRKLDDPTINQLVRAGLAKSWAPAQIAGRMKLRNDDRHVSSQTIYHWIKQSPEADLWLPVLPRRHQRRWPPRSILNRPDASRIRNRPIVIERRMRLGDFEGDTILGPLGTGGLATLVCRKSRFTIVVTVQSKHAEHVYAQLAHRLCRLSVNRRHSITFDNGTEFALCHRLKSQFGIKLYLADPGCPYQRGTNENTNGLIRQYFPKGTDFRTISNHAVRQVERLLNNRPRACLCFRTPAEVFFEKEPPSGCD